MDSSLSWMNHFSSPNTAHFTHDTGRSLLNYSVSVVQTENEGTIPTHFSRAPSFPQLVPQPSQYTAQYSQEVELWAQGLVSRCMNGIDYEPFWNAYLEIKKHGEKVGNQYINHFIEQALQHMQTLIRWERLDAINTLYTIIHTQPEERRNPFLKTFWRDIKNANFPHEVVIYPSRLYKLYPKESFFHPDHENYNEHLLHHVPSGEKTALPPHSSLSPPQRPSTSLLSYQMSTETLISACMKNIHYEPFWATYVDIMAKGKLIQTSHIRNFLQNALEQLQNLIFCERLDSVNALYAIILQQREDIRNGLLETFWGKVKESGFPPHAVGRPTKLKSSYSGGAFYNLPSSQTPISSSPSEGSRGSLPSSEEISASHMT